jgi:2,4-dienoyl-CoA reductase-like NADH-dependent reductase (Old Yellow Enzyme family)/thioredoxin reductase
MLEKLFSPTKIGLMELKNRLVVSPMVCNYCTSDGEATEQYIAYHAEKAKGGFGLIITENYAVTPEARGFTNMACIFDDSLIASHSRLAAAVHAYDAKIVAQVFHAGRQTDPSVNTGVQPVAPSPIPCPDKQIMPRELNNDEIRSIVSAFGDAGRRLRDAGFDGIELQGGHGYLIAEFMSPYANKRVDEYGGPLLNRLRFVKEIIDDIHSKAGADFPILFRISSEEPMPGGRTVQDTMAIAILLESYGVAAFDISIGTYGDGGTTIPSMATSHAWNIESAGKIRNAVDVPIMTVGRINDPITAEAILRSGEADLIVMGRGSLADPALPNKAQSGNIEQIRQCVGCQGCVDALFEGPIICMVNPQLGLEGIPIEKVEKPLNVAVAGGGPGGIEAAHGAAMRGHRITLYEKADRLGGALQIAAYPPYKGELSSYLSWAGTMLKDMGVHVVLNTELTPEIVKETKYDVVIVATGSKAFVPRSVNIEGDKTIDALDILTGNAEAGTRCAVLGGGMIGIETAAYLGWLGRKTTIFEKLDTVAADGDDGLLPSMLALADRYGIDIETETEVLEVHDGKVKLRKHGATETREFDTIVLSFGRIPETALAEALDSSGIKTIMIGDAEKSGRAIHATRSGFITGSRL